MSTPSSQTPSRKASAGREETILAHPLTAAATSDRRHRSRPGRRTLPEVLLARPPKRRPSGAYHEVASFKKPFYSVQSYMLNINRHDSYAQLRSLRNKQISGQGYATGNELAAGLINYSQRGRAYIQEIRSMISVNDFGRFDLPDSDPAE